MAAGGQFLASVADIAALLDSGACSALLLEVEGEAAGLALYYPIVLNLAGKRGLWLEDLFVQPAHRGKGYGLALLKELARITVQGGYGALEWNVLDWNTPSIDFYGQIGAEPQQGWTDQRLTGDARLRALKPPEESHMAEQFDVVVVGGGPGGYVAAIRAAQLKMKVALVEREHLGGICLNWGCIPHQGPAARQRDQPPAAQPGCLWLRGGQCALDFKKVVQRSRGVAGQLSGGVKHLLKKNKVTVFDGMARWLAPASWPSPRTASRWLTSPPSTSSWPPAPAPALPGLGRTAS